MRKPRATTDSKAFDVIMLRNGVTQAKATARDFRRVTVMTTDPLQAMETVEKYHGVCVTQRRAKRR